MESAIRQGYTDEITNLLKEQKPSQEEFNLACKLGNVDVVLLLLSSLGKEDQETINSGFERILKYNHVHLIPHFFWHIDIKHISLYGNTWLHFCRHTESAHWLLQHGVQQTPNNDGSTPLYQACYHNKIEVVKVLLEYGGQQIPNNKKVTPLRLLQ